MKAILKAMRAERRSNRTPIETGVAFDDGFIDPHLRRDRDRAYTKYSPWSRDTSLVSLPLTGDLLSLIGDENEARYTPAERYPRGIFQSCLREVLHYSKSDGAEQGFGLGIGVEEELIDEEDLLSLQLFDLRDIRGEGWDGRVTVRALLMEEF